MSKSSFSSQWGTVTRLQGRQMLNQLLPGGAATCKAAENRLMRSSTRLGEGPGETHEPWGTRNLYGEAEMSRRYFKRPTATYPSLSPSASLLLIRPALVPSWSRAAGDNGRMGRQMNPRPRMERNGAPEPQLQGSGWQFSSCSRNGLSSWSRFHQSPSWNVKASLEEAQLQQKTAEAWQRRAVVS